MRHILLLISHGIMLVVGFVLGVYFLPILTAPDAPDQATLSASAENAMFSTDLTRDLKGSDRLHWGEGSISLTPTQIVHMGKLSPGPDYMVYLVTEFVEDEAGFNAVKDASLNVGAVKSFDGFILDLPEDVDLEAYTTVLVWCEAFGE
ncbi:unnamed protein product, partial [Ectocarpus sp. 12 AP-2014]